MLFSAHSAISHTSQIGTQNTLTSLLIELLDLVGRILWDPHSQLRRGKFPVNDQPSPEQVRSRDLTS